MNSLGRDLHFLSGRYWREQFEATLSAIYKALQGIFDVADSEVCKVFVNENQEECI